MSDTSLNHAEVRILIALAKIELDALTKSTEYKELHQNGETSYYSAGFVSIMITKLEALLGKLLTEG